jgi:hypothetical protein
MDRVSSEAVVHEVGMTVESFRRQLRSEVESICKELGRNYDRDQDRGYAFEIWCSELLLRMEGLEGDQSEFVYGSNDIKIDIAFDDDESKVLYIAQTKYVNINTNPDIPETEVNDFFSRHDMLIKDERWLQKFASDEIHDLLSDYRERAKKGWTIQWFFISTGRASERTKQTARGHDEKVKVKYPNISFTLCDFHDLKELYIRSRSIEASISDYLEIQFPSAAYITKKKPYLTMAALVKGNSLVNLYRKERDSLFAYNIRTFLGKRVNKEIVDTARHQPSDFYYFNNGVSAICTRIEDLGANRFRFYSFQVINGAQTIGSLAAVRDLSSECEVLIRITESGSVKTEKGFNADIIRFNNTQNVIKSSDFRSNDKIQLWLEDRFNKLRPRGAIERPIKYIRKRSFHRVKAATALKFEELAKIRFAFLHEPTRCVADPRSLWTLGEDGGYYEQSFGLGGGEIVDVWNDETFNQAVLAVLVFLELMDRIKNLITQNKSEFYFLQRLRFWGVSLFKEYISAKSILLEDLLVSRTKFDECMDVFWKALIQNLIIAHQGAVRDNISNFALVRNDSRWSETKKTFLLMVKAGAI